jgi:hypothetical protein
MLVGNMNVATLQESGPRVRAGVIAKRYDVTERCVHLWANQGRIPSIKIGKTVRFDLNAVIEAIEGKGAGQ